MSIKYQAKKSFLLLTHFFRRNYIAKVCLHKTKRSGVIKSLDEEIIMQMPLEDDGRPDYCLNCIAKMSIRCAWCGSVILIDDFITLYVPSNTFRIPDYAVIYKDIDGSETLVGCLRKGCGITEVDMNGRWVTPGKVDRFPSPMEMALAQNAAVFVSDINKYPSSVSISKN